MVGLALGTASVAEAAALQGSFQIGGNDSTISLSNTGIEFANAFAPEVTVGTATGDFVGFQSAFIEDIIPSNQGSIDNFLDLSANAPGLNGNAGDGLFTFDVTQSSGLQFSQTIPNLIGISLTLDGLFENDLGDFSEGQAILTFQIADAGITVAGLQSRLDNGETFDGITFSGAAFTTENIEAVHEPAGVLGLAALIGGYAVMKHKRSIAA
ncbi:MAG: hypothetical protein AAGF24_15775, partial [Cyanobacteria bacterium P01_H01_bin.121]